MAGALPSAGKAFEAEESIEATPTTAMPSSASLPATAQAEESNPSACSAERSDDGGDLEIGAAPAQSSKSVGAMEEEEEACKKPAGSRVGAVAGRCRAFFGKRRVKIGVLAAVVFAGLTAFLWPRTPTWTLVGLDIDVQEFVDVMTGVGNVSTPLPIVAQVEIWNPNFLGAKTEQGSVIVYYDGEVMGHGTTGECAVGARAVSHMRVDVVMQFTTELASKLLNGAVANNMQLDVHADVKQPVRLGALEVTTVVQCDVVASASRLMENPADVIVDRQCHYGLR